MSFDDITATAIIITKKPFPFPLVLLGLWCLLNLLDVMLTWVAFQWGGGEFGLLRYVCRSWLDFVIIKAVFPPLVGVVLTIRRMYRVMTIITIAMALVCIWNAWCIIQQFI